MGAGNVYFGTRGRGVPEEILLVEATFAREAISYRLTTEEEKRSEPHQEAGTLRQQGFGADEPPACRGHLLYRKS
jgi:hypothetical protein